jgi:hypothetical protein
VLLSLASYILNEHVRSRFWKSSGPRDVCSVVCILPPVVIALLIAERLGKCKATLVPAKKTLPFMPARPSIWNYLPGRKDRVRRVTHDRQTWPGYWIYHNRDDSISVGTEERDYFCWLPAEITRAVPESVINTIASMVCHAHRKGRKEAYNFLKQFVLEQMRVPDWPHYPMNDLRRMTPPPLRRRTPNDRVRPTRGVVMGISAVLLFYRRLAPS